jgi:hypothetical protein
MKRLLRAGAALIGIMATAAVASLVRRIHTSATARDVQ